MSELDGKQNPLSVAFWEEKKERRHDAIFENVGRIDRAQEAERMNDLFHASLYGNVQRFGFDPRTISWLHADAVMLFIGLVVACWIAARLTATAGSTAASAWAGVLLVTLAQGVVGYTQYLTSLPWLLVLTHMLLAALLVVTLTRAMVASRARAATSA